MAKSEFYLALSNPNPSLLNLVGEVGPRILVVVVGLRRDD